MIKDGTFLPKSAKNTQKWAFSLQKEGFKIEVFDRSLPLTDIVDMALAK